MTRKSHSVDILLSATDWAFWQSSVPGTAWVAPPEKPLYDASQIMIAPPTVAQNMKAANDELRVEDLAVLARKEKARESRAASLRNS